MDGQESVELDWESIEKRCEEYDNGNITFESIHAKMLQMAYEEGYAHCVADHEEAEANLLIMLSSPAGNA